MRFAKICIYLCSSAFISGSIACRESQLMRTPVGYFGPTEPMIDVVERINANNQKLPTLWAKGYFEADVRLEDGSTQFVNGDYTMLFRRPGEYRLVCRKDVAGVVMEMGSTLEQYWMIVRPKVETLWWGEYANIENVDPKLVPVRPDLASELLGIGEFSSDLLRPPAPTMRFNNDADAYMFLWSQPTPAGAPSRWSPIKEVWYDRKTLNPTLVLLFDRDGRVIARAYLGDHQKVPIDGAPESDWPTIAGTFKFFYPDTQSRATFTMSEVKLTNNGVPREGSITFPDADRAGVANVVKVDENAPDRRNAPSRQ